MDNGELREALVRSVGYVDSIQLVVKNQNGDISQQGQFGIGEAKNQQNWIVPEG
jgi:hypothetical protein